MGICDYTKKSRKKTIDYVLICVPQTGLCMATYSIYSNVTKDLELLTVTAHVLVYLIQTGELWQIRENNHRSDGHKFIKTQPSPAESVAQSV